jgi:hypothetical protein
MVHNTHNPNYPCEEQQKLSLNGLAVCISICLTLLTLCTFSN